MHLNAFYRSSPGKTYILVVVKLKPNQIKLVTFLLGMRNSHPQEWGGMTPYILYLTIQRFREGNGTPLQYSCLENPMGGGAWWAAVHGVTRVGYD